MPGTGSCRCGGRRIGDVKAAVYLLRQGVGKEKAEGLAGVDVERVALRQSGSVVGYVEGEIFLRGLEFDGDVSVSFPLVVIEGVLETVGNGLVDDEPERNGELHGYGDGGNGDEVGEAVIGVLIHLDEPMGDALEIGSEVYARVVL